ncbi:hypothetical protein PsorP6_007528 [Peronosclerospora sorghi]|uniref:Uncharacterized protein n=1 Tax=Peronosclerospora sorghi TaxID=230839 RepID=A0ACC0WE58_9STRA|nr:hypothetical protein PsorP6_007528 [Peronosclerospora sorghi]
MKMWEALVEQYEKKNGPVLRAQRINQLSKELEYMPFTPGGDMDMHITIMDEKIAEIEDLYNNMHKFQITKYMLDSVPDYGKCLYMQNVVKWAS